MRTVKHLLVVVLFSGTVVAVPALAIAAGHVVICNTALGADGGTCFHWAAHPAHVEAGADGRTEFIKLHWSHWGTTRATAKGTLQEDSGPAGHPKYQYSKVTMTATRIDTCGRKRAYTKLVIHGPIFGTAQYAGCGLNAVGL